MEDKTNTVPIRLKMTLTAREAAEYSNISINIDSMPRVPNCLFVLFVGTKKLVKRREFEQYISRTMAIEGKFTIEKRKPLCYNIKCVGASSHSEKGVSTALANTGLCCAAI